LAFDAAGGDPLLALDAAIVLFTLLWPYKVAAKRGWAEQTLHEGGTGFDG
jgi:hypothetical protein